MQRRILIIVAGVVVLIGLAVGIYFLFFANKPSLTVGVANPFGTSGDNTNAGDQTTAGPVQGAGIVVAPHLIKITDGPVAKGAVAIDIPPAPEASTTTAGTATGDTEVRYIDRASGNIYAFRVHDRVLTRIGNKTLPGVQEASWFADGSQALVRFLDKGADGIEHVDTYMLPANGNDGFLLEPDLSAAGVVSPTSFFTLLPGASGSVASVARADGTSPKTLFTSLIGQLTLAPAGANFLATTKATGQLPGYSFSVSGTTGAMTRILGPLTGLSALPSPDGASVLFSYVDKGKVYLQVLDTASHATTPLPVATLAEKCVWAPGNRSLYCGVPTALTGALPDDWYQGAAPFSDRIWRIDLDTRLATLIADPNQLAQVSIDAVALTVDPASDVLVFTNKTDGSLWAYDF